MSSSNNHTYSLVVKKSCPTCELIQPAIQQLAQQLNLQVVVQDDPDFLESLGTLDKIDDSTLEYSFHNKIEIVPTLIRWDDQRESGRIVGWDRQQWREFSGITDLGEELIPFKPGCGSMTEDPGMAEVLAARFAADALTARRVDLADAEDAMEACYERGWTDGLPVVPPTAVRVLRMLAGSDRAASEIIGRVPPDNVECSVEKVAINAVLAGCKPDYFPTVLAVVEAALKDEFCMHGLLCTTYFSSPVVIVNGPVVKRIGMNSGGNALGQRGLGQCPGFSQHLGQEILVVRCHIGPAQPGIDIRMPRFRPVMHQHHRHAALCGQGAHSAIRLQSPDVIDDMRPGVKRRFTRTGVVGGITIIDDNGHHPVEIAAVLKAARQACEGRVIAVHQPHRYSRLHSLFDDFCACFNEADVVAIAEVYAAGEDPIPGATRDDLVAGLIRHGHRHARAISTEDDLVALVSEQAQEGDMVVCLGAGTISAWANNLPKRLGE